MAEESGVATRGAASYAEALAGADIACGTTAEGDPAVRRSWLAPGVHVTSVRAVGRELDDATVADAPGASRRSAQSPRR
jgi:ornithine cyclodeaminase/alanine dehydrogenase-like protein (mu-crystallin family)